MRRVMTAVLGAVVGLVLLNSAEAKTQQKPKPKVMTYKYLRISDSEFLSKAPAEGLYVKGYWTGKDKTRTFHVVSTSIQGTGPFCTGKDNQYMGLYDGVVRNIVFADPAETPPAKPFVRGCSSAGNIFRPNSKKLNEW
jgi:hypothetical protein